MLTGLCTYEDCDSFLEGVGQLAVGTQEVADRVATGEKKVTQVHKNIELNLSVYVQERLDRLELTNTDYIETGVLATPAAIIPTLHADSKAYMNNYAMTCWVYEMLKEGQVAFRYKHGEASQQITDSLLIWGGNDGEGGLIGAAWKKIQRLIWFDLDGDGSRDTLETYMRPTPLSSVRIYA